MSTMILEKLSKDLRQKATNLLDDQCRAFNLWGEQSPVALSIGVSRRTLLLIADAIDESLLTEAAHFAAAK